MPAGVATSMEVSDPLIVIPDIADDVAIHDLRMIDIEQDFHARRITRFITSTPHPM